MAEQESFLPAGFMPTPTLADITQDDSLTFRERLVKKFQPNQFVRVVNIDNEPFEWQEVPGTSEYVHQPDKYTYDVYRKAPSRFGLGPNEQKVLEGGSAYIMIEALFKKMVQKQANGKRGKMTEMSSPVAAQDYIDRIVVRVESLSDLTNPNVTLDNNFEATALNDLGLNDGLPPIPVEQPRQPGRPGQPGRPRKVS